MGARESRKQFPTQLSKVALAWRIPDLTHPDMPALDVLATVLGDGRSSRLYRGLRDGKGLAHSIGAYSYTPAHGGLLAVSGDADPDKRDALEGAVKDLLGDLVCNGVSDKEVEKARKITLSDQFHGMTTMRGQAGDLGSNWLLTRNLEFSRAYVKAVETVTAEEVVGVAEKYFKDDSSIVVSLDPPKEGEAAVASKSTAVKKPETEAITLDNGMVLLVRPDHRLPLVSIHCVFKGGLLAETKETAGVTQLLANTLPKGAAGKSAEEIADMIESVGGSIGGQGGNNSFTASAAAMGPDLPLALGLVSDLVKSPDFQESAVSRELQALRAAVKEREDTPTSVAVLEMKQALFGDLPYSLPRGGTHESLDRLNGDALHAFHATHAVGNNGVISVFGDVESEMVKELVEEGFGGIQSGSPAFSDAESLWPELGSPKEIEKELNKEQGVIVIGYPAIDLLHSDRVILNLINEALSDMASRLFVRIREELGLAYYVGASQLVGLAPGAFYVYAGTAPEKVENVRDELLSEVGKIGAEGLSDDELARAKKTYLSKLTIQLQTNSALGQSAALDQLYGLGPDYHLQLGDRVNAVSREDIARVAESTFFEKPYVVSIVRPGSS